MRCNTYTIQFMHLNCTFSVSVDPLSCATILPISFGTFYAPLIFIFSHFLVSSSLNLVTINLLHICMNLPVVDISWKWIYTKCSLCLAYFTWHVWGSSMLYVSVPFRGWKIFHRMNIPHGVYLFIHCWLFKLFLLLANISNGAMNMCTQGDFLVDVYFHFSRVYTWVIWYLYV